MSSELKPLIRAIDYVKENEELIRKAYGNKYVAVHVDRVILGADEDETALARRTNKLFPRQFILVNLSLDKILNYTGINSENFSEILTGGTR